MRVISVNDVIGRCRIFIYFLLVRLFGGFYFRGCLFNSAWFFLEFMYYIYIAKYFGLLVLLSGLKLSIS